MGWRSPTYPFTPRSTVHLVPGQFFSFPLPSGGYSCCQVLPGVWPYRPPTRTRFPVGLLGWRGNSPAVAADLVGRVVVARGWAHVGLFAEYGVAVSGEAPLVADRPGPAADAGMCGIDGLYLFAARLLIAAPDCYGT